MPLQDICDVIAAHCDLKTHSKVTGICPPETIPLSTWLESHLALVLLFLNQMNMKEEREDTPCCIFLVIRHFEQLLYRWL